MAQKISPWSKSPSDVAAVVISASAIFLVNITIFLFIIPCFLSLVCKNATVNDHLFAVHVNNKLHGLFFEPPCIPFKPNNNYMLIRVRDRNNNYLLSFEMIQNAILL